MEEWGLTINSIGDGTPEGMNGEFPPVPRVTNDPLEIVSEG